MGTLLYQMIHYTLSPSHLILLVCILCVVLFLLNNILLLYLFYFRSILTGLIIVSRKLDTLTYKSQIFKRIYQMAFSFLKSYKQLVSSAIEVIVLR